MNRHANHELIPINFRLTQRASDAINRLTTQFSSATQPAFPCLLWNEAYDEIRKQLINQAPVVGWYDRQDVPDTVIQHVDGVDLYFAVSHAQSLHFRGKTIDYENNRFVFAP